MTERQNNEHFIFLIPVVLATAFSFLYLSKQSIWLDEAWSVAFANLGWTELWALISSIEPNMSLYYSTLKIWIGIFGDSEFAVRSLSAILAVLAVAVVYAIGLRLFDTKVALVASLLLASNGYFIRYAQATRSYSMLLLLTAVSMFLFILAIEKQKTKFYFWHGVVNALILYTHFFGIFALISQVVLFLMAPKQTVKWRRIKVSFTTTALLALPLVAMVLLSGQTKEHWWVGEANPSFLNIVDIVMALSGNGGKTVTVIYFLCGVSSLVFAVRKLNVLIDRQSLWKYSVILFWFIFPIACLFLFSFFVPAFRTRYGITALPALVIIAATGLAYISPKTIQRMAIALVIVASIHNLFNQNYLAPGTRDWRTATQTVLTNSHSGDAVVFYSWWIKYPFEYYYRRIQHSDTSTKRLISVWPFPFHDPTSRQNVDAFIDNLNKYREPSGERLEALTRDHDRLWVVLAYDQSEDHGWNSKPIIDSIDKIFEQKAVFPMDGITILLYSRSDKNPLDGSITL